MGKWHFVTLFSVILALGLLFFLNNYKGYDELISPMLKQEKVLGINQWFPKDILDSQETAPKITAKSAIFLDSKDGTILYSKNINEKLPIASLAKVMTVLISLEHKKMEDDFTISKRATEMEPDEMILLPEETLTLKELLYGIFLVSANDAAEVLAESVTGNRDEFIKLMNKKAKQLGMENSYFANPTGLDEDDNNSFSNAYDLAILARFLIHHYPEVVEISKTPYIFIPETESHQSYEMWSGINLLTTYPGVVGFKTGYTPDAGLTLITLARIDGHEVIGVLLGSEARRDEARELLDYSFKKLRV